MYCTNFVLTMLASPTAVLSVSVEC